MQSMKIDVGKLEGKANWPTWRYKMYILLQGTPGALDAVKGNIIKPINPESDASENTVAKYKNDLERYYQINSLALLLITTNMSDETVQKVMRYNNPKEVWDELHRLFDGVSEDRSYDLCMQFFSYKMDPAHDMTMHISKVKNLWFELKNELVKVEKAELPEILLICKILDTVPEEYFSFKSSWLLISKKDRNVDNLTSQLCAYEKALTNRNEETNSKMEALVTTQKGVNIYKKKIKCPYCKELGHKIKYCEKWISAGKPPKQNQPKTSNTNLMLMEIDADQVSNTSIYDNENWYVDNGATSHVTHRKDLFVNFEYFSKSHTVTTANGQSIEAIGKGCIKVKAVADGRKHIITLNDVWYVPSIKRNLFSVLAAQDRLMNSTFESSTNSCQLSVDGCKLLIGNRKRHGGLYKLNLCNINSIQPIEINSLLQTDLLQLYHERLGHQNKRHVKNVSESNLSLDLGPKTYEKAMKSHQKENWLKAMKKRRGVDVKVGANT